MRVLRRGNKDEFKRKFDFECPHCGSSLRAKMCELTPLGTSNSWGFAKRLLFYCPVCESKRVIDRYKLIPVLKISDYISMALGKIADDELIYDDPDMEEIEYEC